MRKLFGFVLVFSVAFIVLMVLHPSSTPEPATDSKAEGPDYGPAVPVSSLRDPTLANAPTLRNTGDTNCRDKEYNLHPCTDQEIAEAQVELQRQWNSEPEWLRKKCVSFTTMDSEAHCEVTETGAYLNAHPGEKAPWTGISPPDAH